MLPAAVSPARNKPREKADPVNTAKPVLHQVLQALQQVPETIRDIKAHQSPPTGGTIVVVLAGVLILMYVSRAFRRS
jgi:hypothetical protein